LLFNDLKGLGVERQQILDALDKVPEIVNWRAATGAIFIASESSGKVLSEKINSAIPRHVHFVLVDAEIDQVWGWTDEETWNFIRRPRRIGEP
jgi:hypothetical protein